MAAVFGGREISRGKLLAPIDLPASVVGVAGFSIRPDEEHVSRRCGSACRRDSARLEIGPRKSARDMMMCARREGQCRSSARHPVPRPQRIADTSASP